MTAKDFELIAAALRHSRPVAVRSSVSFEQWLEDRSAIVARLSIAYPRFDRGRFITATER